MVECVVICGFSNVCSEMCLCLLGSDNVFMLYLMLECVVICEDLVFFVWLNAGSWVEFGLQDGVVLALGRFLWFVYVTLCCLY